MLDPFHEPRVASRATRQAAKERLESAERTGRLADDRCAHAVDQAPALVIALDDRRLRCWGCAAVEVFAPDALIGRPCIVCGDAVGGDACAELLPIAPTAIAVSIIHDDCYVDPTT